MNALVCLYRAAMRAADIRKARGLSQDDLAEMVGVEQPTISRFERGYDGVTLRLIRQIATALGVSVGDLFTDERSAAEQLLVEAFRSLPEDRQKGWLDLARVVREGPPQA